MQGLRVIRPAAKAVIMKMEWVSVTPPTLDIYMDAEFRDILQILFDNRQADTWAMVTPNRVRVLVPNPGFSKVQVFVEPYNLNAAGVRVEFEGNRFVRGPERLLQIVSRFWMTEEDSVMDYPGIGAKPSPQEMNDASDRLPYLISAKAARMSDYIVRAQKSQTGLMDSERLVRIDVVACFSISGMTGVSVFLRIVTRAGSLMAYLSTEV